MSDILNGGLRAWIEAGSSRCAGRTSCGVTGKSAYRSDGQREQDGETKTAASNGYVPMHPVLAEYLKEWRAQSPHSKVDDFVFPSLLKDGKVPIWASIFVQDHLRPAAISAGVVLAKGQRFGLHNLRHSSKHLAGEQREGRSEDGSGNVAA